MAAKVQILWRNRPPMKAVDAEARRRLSSPPFEGVHRATVTLASPAQDSAAIEVRVALDLADQSLGATRAGEIGAVLDLLGGAFDELEGRVASLGDAAVDAPSPMARVISLHAQRGVGVLETAGGRALEFTAAQVVDDRFGDLAVGDPVYLVEAFGEGGAQVCSIHVVDALRGATTAGATATWGRRLSQPPSPAEEEPATGTTATGVTGS